MQKFTDYLVFLFEPINKLDKFNQIIPIKISIKLIFIIKINQFIYLIFDLYFQNFQSQLNI